MDKAAFWRLREDPLSGYGSGEWDAYYRRMSPWLLDEEAEIRECALERLSTAVFWAEGSDRRGEAGIDEMMLGRTLWFLEIVEEAARQRPDLIARLLLRMRWHLARGRRHEAVMGWLSALAARGLSLQPEGLVEGTILLWQHEDASSEARWRALLDHPSDYVRGCVARRLAAFCPDDADGEDAFLAEITARERARPGIAGPFWSGWEPDVCALRFDPVAWMVDIVETRSGPEPADMPFNGIDFHLHELAGDKAPAVRRLLDGGHAELALQAATEVQGVVPGMREILRELGRNANPEIASGAHLHLAYWYREMHPDADGRSLRHLPGWMPGVDALVAREGNAAHWREVAIFYPAADERDFDDASAWRVIDAALPPILRGEREKHFLALHGSGPEPYRLGDDELHAFASGALVTLYGGAETRRWRRIAIIGRGLQRRWFPFDWITPNGP